jgi:hypothetical protein
MRRDEALRELAGDFSFSLLVSEDGCWYICLGCTLGWPRFGLGQFVALFCLSMGCYCSILVTLLYPVEYLGKPPLQGALVSFQQK